MMTTQKTPTPWTTDNCFPVRGPITQHGFSFAQAEDLGRNIEAEKHEIKWPDLHIDDLAWKMAQALCGVNATPSEVAMRAAVISKNLKEG